MTTPTAYHFAVKGLGEDNYGFDVCGYQKTTATETVEIAVEICQQYVDEVVAVSEEASKQEARHYRRACSPNPSLLAISPTAHLSFVATSFLIRCIQRIGLIGE